MSSGTAVCMDLGGMLSLCSQLISSVTAACRASLVAAFTAFC